MQNEGVSYRPRLGFCMLRARPCPDASIDVEWRSVEGIADIGRAGVYLDNIDDYAKRWKLSNNQM